MKQLSKIIMSHSLRKELQDYLSELESLVFSEDAQFFDEQVSRLIDCIHYLLEEG